MRASLYALAVALFAASVAPSAFAKTAGEHLDSVTSAVTSSAAKAVDAAESSAAKAVNSAESVVSGDVVDVAVAAGDFKTLAKLLDAAGLVTTLKGEGPYTVFAPTDAAFSKLPAKTLADLQKPESKDELTKILTYHVLSGKTMAADLKGKKLSPATVEGATLAIDATGKSVKVNDAKVVKADVAASNGVIHVIDTVLLPAAK